MGVGGNRKQLQRISPVQIFTSRRGLAGTENSCRASHQCIYSPVDGGWHSSKTAAENLTSADIHQSMGVGGNRKQLQRISPVQILTSRRGLAGTENSCRASHQCIYSPVEGGWHSAKTAAENLTSANIHQSMRLAGTENSCRESHQCKYSPVDGGWHSSKTAAENLTSADIHQSKGVGIQRKQLQKSAPVKIFTSQWGLAFIENSCRELRQRKDSPVNGGWHSSKTAAENLTSANIHQSMGLAG